MRGPIRRPLARWRRRAAPAHRRRAAARDHRPRPRLKAQSATLDAIARLGTVGLYLFAFSALWKNGPAHVGIALALLAVPIGLFAAPPRRLDVVWALVVALAAWQTARAALQFAGLGDPGLIKEASGFRDWMAPLAFAPLAALPTSDRVRRTAALWLTALVGCSTGIVTFLSVRGIDVLWSDERLGFHLDRPLGIGLYAGCFVLVAAGTWRYWWFAPRYRWPARLLGVATLLLYFQVLVTAQSRSTYLGLVLVALLALGAGFWSARTARSSNSASAPNTT